MNSRQVTVSERIAITSIKTASLSQAFHALYEGLQLPVPTVPSMFCWDDAGSQLFEDRCEQNEYYLRRLEIELLKSHVAEMHERIGPCVLCDLGSGSSLKLDIILEEFLSGDARVRYVPVDINERFLTHSAWRLAERFSGLEVHGLVSDYHEALTILKLVMDRKLLLFLGSTLGNMTPQAANDFFANISRATREGDFFLIGLDLIKDPRVLELAYDDAAGVGFKTELNALNNINKLFCANFDLAAFSYRASYCPKTETVQALLTTDRDQKVHFPQHSRDFELARGQSIKIGNMRKFSLDAVERDLSSHAFSLEQAWHDPAGWYAVCLFRRKA
jgi:L-histidine N-alpha-methyltransferase